MRKGRSRFHLGVAGIVVSDINRTREKIRGGERGGADRSKEFSRSEAKEREVEAEVGKRRSGEAEVWKRESKVKSDCRLMNLQSGSGGFRSSAVPYHVE